MTNPFKTLRESLQEAFAPLEEFAEQFEEIEKEFDGASEETMTKEVRKDGSIVYTKTITRKTTTTTTVKND